MNVIHVASHWADIVHTNHSGVVKNVQARTALSIFNCTFQINFILKIGVNQSLKS